MTEEYFHPHHHKIVTTTDLVGQRASQLPQIRYYMPANIKAILLTFITYVCCEFWIFHFFSLVRMLFEFSRSKTNIFMGTLTFIFIFFSFRVGTSPMRQNKKDKTKRNVGQHFLNMMIIYVVVYFDKYSFEDVMSRVQAAFIYWLVSLHWHIVSIPSFLQLHMVVLIHFGLRKNI